MRTAPRVCVIGAGCSGLSAVKALREAGIEHRAFELGSTVGGNWVFQNDSGRSGAYRSLHINTSRAAMEFRDFPLPSELPDYPHHRHVAAYLENYARAFDLHDSIAFRTEVVRCERAAPGSRAGGWNVWIRNLDAAGETKEMFFDALIVANGHHWDPALPEPMPPGRFDGRCIHSHDYIDSHTPLDAHGKRILVVGMGNSAMDIACELCHPGVAERLFLSVRRGAWVVPKYILGKPADQGNRIPRWLPSKLRRWVATKAFEVLFGKMEDYGLPKPDHLLLEAHPTMSSDLLTRIGSGDIAVRPAIERFDGDGVIFSDGTREAVDAIVFCTGYRVSFPFFEEALIAAPDNDLPLFRRVFHPEFEDVFFVGLAQPLGAIMPIVERQSFWIAEYLSRRYALPNPSEMNEDMQKEHRERKERYVPSRRHTMQVDLDRYLRELDRELRRGHGRALSGEGVRFTAHHPSKTRIRLSSDPALETSRNETNPPGSEARRSA